MTVRYDPYAAALFGSVVEELRHAHNCECGAAPVFIGRFISRTGTGGTIGNAMLLCAVCAALCDAGVRLERIGERKQ